MKLYLSKGKTTAKSTGRDWAQQIITTILKRPIPFGVEIHHVDGDNCNNKHTNLVVCPNKTYHKLLHTRQNALNACSNPDWRKCVFCKQYDSQDNLVKQKSGANYLHIQCWSNYNKKYWRGDIHKGKIVEEVK